MFNPFRRKDLDRQIAKQRGEVSYNLPDAATAKYIGRASRGASFKTPKPVKYQLPDDVLDYSEVRVSRIRGRKIA